MEVWTVNLNTKEHNVLELKQLYTETTAIEINRKVTEFLDDYGNCVGDWG
jgi:hypothetical protein